MPSRRRCRTPWGRPSATSRASAATDAGQIVFGFSRPSPFLLEALEVPVPKPGSTLIGTGPFQVSNPQSPTEMRANDDYCLGRPAIGSHRGFRATRASGPHGPKCCAASSICCTRSGADALDSSAVLEQDLHVYFVRRYQFAVVMNNQSTCSPPTVRRALNLRRSIATRWSGKA